MTSIQAAPKPKRMGYQPALDGIRTFSVGLVAVHHAEIIQMEVVGGHHERLIGGFVYPEMFFVMSGFLITTLMLQEREGTGKFGVKAFYGRRARRLLPGLWVMMLLVTTWAVFWGTVRLGGVAMGNVGLSGLRQSALPTLLMGTNWWMIFSGNGYFGSFPNLLRHIWSLSIDEQFYIIWPVVLWLVMRGPRFDLKRLAKVIAPFIIAGWILMAVVYRSPANGDHAALNFAYLSTTTRMPGILVGCVLACVWRPWTWKGVDPKRHLGWLDLAGLGSFVLILVISLTVHNESAVPYRGLFPVVSLLAATLSAAVVHPGAKFTRMFFGNKVISGIGKRAFGIYLWHWPLLAGPLATSSITTKLVVGVPVTAVLAELSYRFIEGPFRERRVDAWWQRVKALPAELRWDRMRHPAIAAGAVGFLAIAGTAALVTARNVDLSVDTRDVSVDLGKVTGEASAAAPAIGAGGTGTGTGGVTGTGTGNSVAPATSDTTTGVTGTGGTSPAAEPAGYNRVEPATHSGEQPTHEKVRPVRLAVVGSSQADVFVKNKPNGIGEVFQISGDGKGGCGVFDSGSLITKRGKFGWDFKVCKGWQKEWAGYARTAKANVTMVMTGGWEVFSLKMPDGSRLEFASPEWDATFIAQLKSGVDAVLATGSKVALLEPPCQRPIETPAAGVPPLPERRDDSRMAHVGELMLKVAESYDRDVFYLDGPDEWCDDPSIGENTSYRYDGVHVLKPGAKLILEKVGPQLLDIADNH